MKKILISLLVLVAGATGFATVHYVLWMNASIARLEAGSQVVMTPRGRVEYAISGTEGPVILFLHGTPGGYDQGAHFALVAAEEGFRFVRPSRPGYLRTPLEVGRTPAEQADAYVALLDALGLRRVAVVGLSGGGPSAFEFALRYPDRCFAMVSISGRSRARPSRERSTAQRLMGWLTTTNVAGWLTGTLVSWRPNLLVRPLSPEVRAEVLADPAKLAILKGFADTLIVLPAARQAGRSNDIEQFQRLPRFPLETMQVPVLVIHGTEDESVPFANAEFVAQTAPRVVLHAVEGGGHGIVLTHAERLLPIIFEFVREHASSSRPTG